MAAIKTYKPITNGRRNMTVLSFEEITTSTPEKSLLAPVKKNSGRNNTGRITVRHQGGGAKQKYRIIDFKRNIASILVSKSYSALTESSMGKNFHNSSLCNSFS